MLFKCNVHSTNNIVHNVHSYEILYVLYAPTVHKNG